MARRLAADDRYMSSFHAKVTGKRFDQLGVCLTIFGRRMHPDLERAVFKNVNALLRRLWFYMDGEAAHIYWLHLPFILESEIRH